MMTTFPMSAGTPFAKFVAADAKATEESYLAKPALIAEQLGGEINILGGGYGYRQIIELVQNGADAIQETGQVNSSVSHHRIEVTLTEKFLYVANTGTPVTEEGLQALLMANHSTKKGMQIGRFGLGFKSLLALEGKIDLFSRTNGAVQFDPRRCKDYLKQMFEVPDAPGLRLAWPIDEKTPFVSDDDVLSKYFAWSETVIRAEIGNKNARLKLKAELNGFREEFLLFLPVSLDISLSDISGDQPAKRNLTLRHVPENGHVFLRDGDKESEWIVASGEAKITDPEAINDAQSIHYRESVPVSWAFPVKGVPTSAGKFWAFFPTETDSGVPGIINAPWKLNSDRTSVISGKWSEALMEKAADLVADTLPRLNKQDDPGHILDAFPRRTEKKEIAYSFVEAVWNRIQDKPLVSDCSGTLKVIDELNLHPADVNSNLVGEWIELANEETKTSFVHPSCFRTRERESRLNELAERRDVSPVEFDEWFDSIASTDPNRSLQVLNLVQKCSDEVKREKWHIVSKNIAVVLTQEGNLVTPDKAILSPEALGSQQPVAAQLLSNEEACRILNKTLGVTKLDDAAWQRFLAEAWQQCRNGTDNAAWTPFWRALRAAPPEMAKKYLSGWSVLDSMRIKRNDGKWVAKHEALLPGNWIAENDQENGNSLVDQKEHAADGDLLKYLGISEEPDESLAKFTDTVLLNAYLAFLRKWNRQRFYRNEISQLSKSLNDDRPYGFRGMPRCCSFLAKLKGNASSKLTLRLISLFEKENLSSKLNVNIGSPSDLRIKEYTEVPHPLYWLLWQYGALEVRGESLPLSVLGSASEYQRKKLGELIEQFSKWKKIDEYGWVDANAGEHARQNLWVLFVQWIVTPEKLAETSLEEFWTAAAEDGFVPETLPHGIRLEDVHVTSSKRTADVIAQSGFNGTVVLLPPSALPLWVEKGAKNLEDGVDVEYARKEDSADIRIPFPELETILDDGEKKVFPSRCVGELNLKISREISRKIPCILWKDELLWDESILKQSKQDRWKSLLGEMLGSAWITGSVEDNLNVILDSGVQKRRKEVASQKTLEERLAEAVGNRKEMLLQALDELAEASFVKEECTEVIPLARLVLAQHGPATLSKVETAMTEEGLKPPKRWNTDEARDFVSEIGFPLEFASSEYAKREAEEFVSGPIPLPLLHDFQAEVHAGLKSLLNMSGLRRRAVVSLPTGGGKTRVTVQAAVELVLAQEGAHRCVVWVAQSDELCEQAVQAFRQVWVNCGTRQTDLRIVRLWGGQKNPVVLQTEDPIVVVASIQTLNYRVEDLPWLAQAGMLVIDECHHAIGKSYTSLLRQVMPDAKEESIKEPPIIGLSATPFRVNDDESKRLASRFDGRWFPKDQEKLHDRLREQGVLSEVINEELKSNEELSDGLLAKLATVLDELHTDATGATNVINAIDAFFAGNEARNEMIVKKIKDSSEDSILLFANSVKHSRELAALLHLRGIEAAHIDGETPNNARRYFLNQFQSGKIRVLCNYGVLSTGFDAPKTNMILISRIIFSPVRYMQIVGRGLRGPSNGGTDYCRLVTVIDNLNEYGNKLAYHFCKQYFK